GRENARSSRQFDSTPPPRHILARPKGTPRKRPAGREAAAGAKGATAPETLRRTDRGGIGALESGRGSAPPKGVSPARGANLSGPGTEGAEPRGREPRGGPSLSEDTWPNRPRRSNERRSTTCTSRWA